MQERMEREREKERNKDRFISVVSPFQHSRTEWRKWKEKKNKRKKREREVTNRRSKISSPGENRARDTNAVT